MTPHIQLLVHAGAPSNRSDDDKYRLQARAYLAFRSTTTATSLQPTREIRDGDDIIPQDQGVREAVQSQDETTFLDDTQLALNALESQLATSSLPIINDSPLPPDVLSRHSASVIPIRRASRKRCLSGSDQDQRSPKRVQSSFIPHLEDGRAGLAYVGEEPLIGTELSVRTPEQKQCGDLDALNETTSELPTSYSLSDITSESSRARLRLDASQRSASDPGPRIDVVKSIEVADLGDGDRLRPASAELPVDKETTAVTVPTAEEVSPRERPANTHISGTAEEHPLAFRARMTTVVGQERQIQSLRTSLLSLSTSAYPPEPDPGQKRFTTHVTDSLRFLVESPIVGNKYAPVFVARALRPLERGYWRVDCSTWPLPTQVDFWVFVDNTIRRGNAGWGVWCIRNDAITPPIAAQQIDSIGLVKVFCWGEVVQHVYLLLYAASKSQVKKLGLQWIDAEGKAVVQMKQG